MDLTESHSLDFPLKNKFLLAGSLYTDPMFEMSDPNIT